MSDCLFCAIGAGDIPSVGLMESDHAMAFLDINPLRPGHALVIPKRHGVKHHELDAESRTAVWDMVARLTPQLNAVTKTTDATIAIHDGAAAGQEIPHCHVHIVPRAPEDGGASIHSLFSKRAPADPEALHDLAIRIQQVN